MIKNCTVLVLTINGKLLTPRLMNCCNLHLFDQLIYKIKTKTKTKTKPVSETYHVIHEKPSDSRLPLGLTTQ